MQFKGKLIHQTSENSKRPNSKPDFGLFHPNLGPQTFSAGFTSYGKKPNFGPNFDSNLVSPKRFFVSFTSTRYYKLLMQAIIVYNFKEN